MNDATGKLNQSNLTPNNNQMTEILLTVIFIVIIVWSGLVLFGSNL
jgi:surface polysaccharide O-acyltransferase-like enzyme